MTLWQHSASGKRTSKQANKDIDNIQEKLFFILYR